MTRSAKCAGLGPAMLALHADDGIIISGWDFSDCLETDEFQDTFSRALRSIAAMLIERADQLTTRQAIIEKKRK